MHFPTVFPHQHGSVAVAVEGHGIKCNENELIGGALGVTQLGRPAPTQDAREGPHLYAIAGLTLTLHAQRIVGFLLVTNFFFEATEFF